MARLDRAIHEKSNEFSVALDGRVKPGHDSSGHRQLFHTLIRGDDAAATPPRHFIFSMLRSARPNRKIITAENSFCAALTVETTSGTMAIGVEPP